MSSIIGHRGTSKVSRTVHPAWQNCWRIGKGWQGWSGRGTWWHQPSFCVASVALGDINLRFAGQAWRLWRWAGSSGAVGAWSPLVACDAAALRVAGLALGDIKQMLLLTHRGFYTQTLLHTNAFTHKRFYTQTLLHTDPFTHRGFYTQTLLNTDAFTHRYFATQTLFTHRSFYTNTHWTGFKNWSWFQIGRVESCG